MLRLTSNIDFCFRFGKVTIQINERQENLDLIFYYHAKSGKRLKLENTVLGMKWLKNSLKNNLSLKA